MAKVKWVDLDKYLHHAKKRIYRVGIELEGGWDSLPPDTHLVHDGSVRIRAVNMTADEQARYLQLSDTYNRGVITREQSVELRKLQAKMVGPANVGELPSPPLEVESISKWMKTFFPHHVNETCGLHVHMSFRSALNYQRLMVPSYQTSIIEYVGRWGQKMGIPETHPLWPRLRGKSRFCQHQFHADLQVNQRQKGHDQNSPGHRYTVINYPWNLHQTVECRLLPMFDDVKTSISAVEEILDITNAFLFSHRKKETRHEALLNIEDDSTRRSIQDYV